MSASRHSLLVVASAFAILLIVTGARQSSGLFVDPIHADTGISLVAISFALAVGQLVWGATQPLFGMLADRHGPARVIVAGSLLFAAGSVLTTFARSEWTLTLAFGVLSAAGAGAGSFAVLIGATAARIPAQQRAMASGVINAGGSAGQMIFAPLVQAIIGSFGWIAAMYTIAATAIATIPFARPLARRHPVSPEASPAPSAAVPTVAAPTPAAAPVPGLRAQLGEAARSRDYWLLNVGFFTCGFHIAFLVTHLPGEVGLCGLTPTVAANSLAIIGLANVAGSLASGWLGGVMRMKWLLSGVYFARAAAIAIYLLLPRTPLNFYLFAAALGLTWLSTVPPTAGLVGKIFGVRHLATLFGFSMFAHQIGGFFGAWLGGLTRSAFGDYSWMWYADIALALAAGLVNLPIREARLAPMPRPGVA